MTLQRAREPALPVISGGDRHICEPNALLNLTNANSFGGFAAEVRAGWSNVVLLPQYRKPHRLRIMHNMYNVLRDYPDHGFGWVRWSDRVFYRTEDGRVSSLTQIWGDRPPASVGCFLRLMGLVGSRPGKSALRIALQESEELA